MSARIELALIAVLFGSSVLAAALAVAGERRVRQPNPLNGPIHILTQER